MRPRDLIRLLPYIVILLAWIAGLFVDVMEIDAAQYATMAADMAQTGDFLHLMDQGDNYLDKPPLIFWLSALSFKIFGVSTWAYKLPSLLFAVLAIFSTARLAELLYDRKTSELAAIILSSTQAFFLMNQDVKTDMYLIGGMAFALWQLMHFARKGGNWHLVLGAVGIGLGMLGKGPVAIVAVGLAMGSDFLLRRDWKGLLRWQWLMVLPLALLVTAPFCLGLYQQYGWEGVEFFYWTQSFGRVTGASEWQNDATPFFFVHTFAWSFLPWTLFFIAGFYKDIRRVIRNGFLLPGNSEGMMVGGFLLIFLALSMSRFKLPHYIFLTFPFAAIIAGKYVRELLEKPIWTRWDTAYTWVHFGIWMLGTIGLILLATWAFPVPIWLTVMFGLASGAALVFFFLKNTGPDAEEDHRWKRMIFPTALGFALCNFFLNAGLYPQLLSYQSSAQVGKYISEKDLPRDRVFAYDRGGRAMDFYSGQVPKLIMSVAEFSEKAGQGPYYLYTSEKGLSDLKSTNLKIEMVKEYTHYPVAKLSLPFVNPALRNKVTSQRYFLRVTAP